MDVARSVPRSRSTGLERASTDVCDDPGDTRSSVCCSALWEVGICNRRADTCNREADTCDGEVIAYNRDAGNCKRKADTAYIPSCLLLSSATGHKTSFSAIHPSA